MYMLMLVLLRFDFHYCANPRSVNLALETVLEFDKDSDLSIVDKVQNFLTKVKSTIQESKHTDTRRSLFRFSDFYGELLGVLKSYNDIDLKFLLDAVENEINSVDNCEDDPDKDFDLRRYLNEKLYHFKNIPGSELRQNIDDILRKIKDEDYEQNNGLVRFLNAVFTTSTRDAFKDIINNLQLYRRRGRNTKSNLRNIVKNGLGIVITDYYCKLNSNKRREVKHLLKYMWNDEPRSKTNKRKGKRKRPSLRIQNEDWKRTELLDIRDNDIQPTSKFVKVTYNTIKDSFETRETQIKEDTDDNKRQKKPLRKHKKKKTKKPSKNRYQTQFYNTDAPDKYGNKYLEVDTEKSEMSAKKSTPPETTKGGYTYYKEAISNESLFKDFNSKENNYLIKDKNVADRKRKKEAKRKLNLIYVGKNKKSHVSMNKKKQILKKIMSNDISDYVDKSKEDSSWMKYVTTKNKLKTFITLYPERIGLYNNKIEDKKKISKTTEFVRKRFKIISSKDVATESVDVANNAEIDVNIDSNLLKAPSTLKSFKTHPIPYEKNSIKKSHHRKHSKAKKSRFKSQPHLGTKKIYIGMSSDTFNKYASSLSHESKSTEYFGSLYKKLNNKRHKYLKRGFRKSNDKDNLHLSKSNDTSNATDKKGIATVTVPSTDRTTDNQNNENEFATVTYGTLAFWSGTEKSTFVTAQTTGRDMRQSVTSGMTSLVSNTSASTESSTTVSYETILNTTNSSRKVNNMNNSEVLDELNISTDNSSVKNGTDNILDTVNTTDTQQYNVTTIKNDRINATEPYKLRRYLDQLEEVGDEDDEFKKKAVEVKVKEDMDRIFMRKPKETIGNATMDPIDELEEAFNF